MISSFQLTFLSRRFPSTFLGNILKKKMKRMPKIATKDVKNYWLKTINTTYVLDATLLRRNVLSVSVFIGDCCWEHQEKVQS